MHRRLARALHTSTNMAFWMENPNWEPQDPAFKALCGVVRALPFSLYEAQRKLFYDTDKVLAISGETVVTAAADGKVDKFMFRYPGKMALEAFKWHTEREVNAVTTHLAGVALPTTVGIKEAAIFRSKSAHATAVFQSQPRLDLQEHPPLDLNAVADAGTSPARDRTAQDLERLLQGIDTLYKSEGLYPDIANNGGNLRRSISDGSVSLVDVMPVYEDGDRLIHDGASILPHILENIDTYQAFVGQYGA